MLGGDEPGKVTRSSLRLLLKLSQSPVVRLNLSRRRKSKPASTEYSELSPVLEAWHPRPWHSPRRTRGSRRRRGARGRASLATGCKHRSGSSGLSGAAGKKGGIRICDSLSFFWTNLGWQLASECQGRDDRSVRIRIRRSSSIFVERAGEYFVRTALGRICICRLPAATSQMAK